ncbi:hypothetical protein SAMN05444414_11714 [Roseovarius marisflavi]|uniref:Phasin protein n=2 Tax=Roseovarius marisflavi TaxID=1054996 RepID=A0A1M7B9R9_9RHOB|nr:hypothetical protein SAMN05444414_11714 [Roseovarius marisflavi]
MIGCECLVAMTQEFVSFLGERLDHDKRLMSDLAHLQTPGHARSFRGGFFDTARQDYGEETRQLTVLCVDGLSDAATEMQDRTEETLAVAFGGMTDKAASKTAEAS